MMSIIEMYRKTFAKRVSHVEVKFDDPSGRRYEKLWSFDFGVHHGSSNSMVISWAQMNEHLEKIRAEPQKSESSWET